MKPVSAAAIALMALLAAASSATAQRDGADRADRGQRLDSDAFRNDMLQDQLKKPTYPQNLQGTSEPRAGDKPKPGTRKPKPN